MLQAALRLRHRAPPLGLRAVPAPAARGPAVRRGRRRRPRARRDRGVPVRRRRARVPARRDVVDEPTLDWLADYRFTGDIWGYAEGETYFPYSPLLVVESTFAEAVLLETVLLSIYNHDSRDRLGRVPDDAGGRRPAVHRDGLAAHPRGGRGRGRAGGVRRRLRRHLEPRGPAPVRRPDGRHQRALASRCCTTPRRTPSARRSTSLGKGTTLLVDTYDIAEAVRLGGRGRRAGARRGPASTPATSAVLAHQVRAQLDELGATEHPDRRHQRPRRVRDRRRWRRRRSTGTASAPSWSPAAATRPAASSTSWSPARTTTGDAGRRWPRRATTRSRSAAASTPCAGATRDGVAEAEVVGIGTPPVDDGDDRPLLVAAGPRRRGGRPRRPRGRPRAAPRARAELPLAARQMSRGEPVIPTPST